MTDIEHLENIQEECISHISCAGCLHYSGNSCDFVPIFHSRPYRWDLTTFKGAINNEKT